MVDEKLEEQVWVTVVATGYGDKRPARSDDRASGLREPAGEPRVSRMRRPERDSRIDVDVPEYIPRF
jgi:cell division protein FtsZ